MDPTKLAPAILSIRGSQLVIHPVIVKGQFDVEVTVSDGAQTAKRTSTVMVANTKPILDKIADVTMLHSQDMYRIDLSGRDADKDVLTYSARIINADAKKPPPAVVRIEGNPLARYFAGSR